MDQLKSDIIASIQNWRTRLNEISCDGNIERAQKSNILRQLYQLEAIVMPYDPW